MGTGVVVLDFQEMDSRSQVDRQHGTERAVFRLQTVSLGVHAAEPDCTEELGGSEEVVGAEEQHRIQDRKSVCRERV